MATRGSADVLMSVVGDLRNHQPLIDLLPSRRAVYAGHPTDDYGFPISVTITPIYEGSVPHRGVIQRDYRVQVTVVSTYEWREQREPNPGALFSMNRILDRVGDRLDRAPGFEEIAQESVGGVTPQWVTGEGEEGGRMMITLDWRLQGWYIQDYMSQV